MDLNEKFSFEGLQQIYNRYFSLKFLGLDVNRKFALISLTCFLYDKLKAKNPDVTHWSILYQINKNANLSVPEDYLKGLAVICADFSYGCTEFPTFGIQPKDIPTKIKELLDSCLPF